VLCKGRKYISAVRCCVSAVVIKVLMTWSQDMQLNIKYMNSVSVCDEIWTGACTHCIYTLKYCTGITRIHSTQCCQLIPFVLHFFLISFFGAFTVESHILTLYCRKQLHVRTYNIKFVLYVCWFMSLRAAS
jgi:hypothetical protein